jgi:hypothetical protein
MTTSINTMAADRVSGRRLTTHTRARPRARIDRNPDDARATKAERDDVRNRPERVAIPDALFRPLYDLVRGDDGSRIVSTARVSRFSPHVRVAFVLLGRQTKIRRGNGPSRAAAHIQPFRDRRCRAAISWAA